MLKQLMCYFLFSSSDEDSTPVGGAAGLAVSFTLGLHIVCFVVYLAVCLGLP
jgi:high-affinity Fe2+/Pb2+ permease